MIEDYSPIYVGDTQVPFACSFQHKDGSVVSLAGATITMKMQDTAGNIKICSGTWTIDNATLGLAHYQWQTADTNAAGTWTLFVTITIGGLPVHADAKILIIQEAP